MSSNTYIIKLYSRNLVNYNLYMIRYCLCPYYYESRNLHEVSYYVVEVSYYVVGNKFKFNLVRKHYYIFNFT